MPRPDTGAAEERELRTDTDRAPAVLPDPSEPPVSERDSLPETDRRDVEDPDDLDDAPDDDPEDDRDEPPLCPEPRPPAVTPVAGDASMPRGETTGVSPQVSQYSSPPPTSSYDPEQPGR
ncbi:hypothetical protein [Streptomyces olivoreticuli]|uniref:hypothetical protein n=1 Tax=Streptomyces olivoreticuli TaxID=68246 RepID=UPI003CC7E71B